MNLFRLGQGKCPCLGRVTILEGELLALRHELAVGQSLLRQLEGEQASMHDQVRKWMRRAVAAERTAERAEQQAEGTPPDISADTPLNVRPAAAWGARARIAARRAGNLVREGDANGVHS